MRPRANEWCNQLAGDGVRWILVGLDAERQFLAFLAGNVERSEHPVPQRKAASVIAIEVPGIF
jgi:hypothetical protein